MNAVSQFDETGSAGISGDWIQRTAHQQQISRWTPINLPTYSPQLNRYPIRAECPAREQKQNKEPDSDNASCSYPTRRPRGIFLRLLTCRGENAGREQTNDQRHSSRNQHEIIQIAQQWNKVGNEIDWTERVRSDAKCKQTDEERSPRIASRVVGDKRKLLHLPGPLPQRTKEGHAHCRWPALSRLGTDQRE